MVLPSKQISIAIEKPAKEVYEFISNPANLPLWAAGLSGSIEKVGNDWIAESPLGKVKVRFEAKNHLGVLDHYVTLPNGEISYNPLRVFPNETGSELVFTLFHRKGMTDEEFKTDVEFVTNDLQRLKNLLEEKA